MRKGGQVIQEESDRIGFVPVGKAALTSAGRLPARFVIHTVGPRWGEGDEEAKLASAVTSALDLAEEKGLATVAMPAVSGGIFGFPKENCAHIIVREIAAFGRKAKTVKTIDIYLMDAEIIGFFAKEVERTRERHGRRLMCGIFGIFGHPEASNMTYLGLHALQHRGQESAGIVSTDGSSMYMRREMGLVSDIFNEETLREIPGHAAIGHVRYSTAGSSTIKNAQPFARGILEGSLAIAHNGNLTNAKIIRDELQNYGSIFQSTIRHRGHRPPHRPLP